MIVAVEAFVHAGPADGRGRDPARRGRRHAGRGGRAQPRVVERGAAEHGVGTVRVAADDAERALFWKGRKTAFGAVAQIAPHYHLHDCVVPRTRLVEILDGHRTRSPSATTSSS